MDVVHPGFSSAISVIPKGMVLCATEQRHVNTSSSSSSLWLSSACPCSAWEELSSRGKNGCTHGYGGGWGAVWGVLSTSCSSTWLVWSDTVTFRNGISILCPHEDSPNHTLLSLPCFPLHLPSAVGWRRELEAERQGSWGCDKNSLMEQQWFTWGEKTPNNRP